MLSDDVDNEQASTVMCVSGICSDAAELKHTKGLFYNVGLMPCCRQIQHFLSSTITTHGVKKVHLSFRHNC